jgi:hypothetical protein
VSRRRYGPEVLTREWLDGVMRHVLLREITRTRDAQRVAGGRTLRPLESSSRTSTSVHVTRPVAPTSDGPAADGTRCSPGCPTTHRCPPHCPPVPDGVRARR